MFHKILPLSDGLPWFSTYIIDYIYILPHKKIMNLHTVHDRAVNNSLISLMYIRMCYRYITVKLNTANRKDGRARFCTATHRFPRRKAPPSLFQNAFSLRENAPWKRKRSAKRKVISYSEKWRSSDLTGTTTPCPIKKRRSISKMNYNKSAFAKVTPRL